MHASKPTLIAAACLIAMIPFLAVLSVNPATAQEGAIVACRGGGPVTVSDGYSGESEFFDLQALV